ncbi:MAG: hypothetical protein WC666_01790 [Candidatus Paceibacterota bacterium]|jgi:hypothetical protein
MNFKSPHVKTSWPWAEAQSHYATLHAVVEHPEQLQQLSGHHSEVKEFKVNFTGNRVREIEEKDPE